MNHSTNWYDKSIDEIYAYHAEITEEKEALEFLLHLVSEFPKLELDWVNMLIDSAFVLLDAGELELVVAAADKILEVFPEEYMLDYELLEKEFISHYLYRDDLENVKKRLGIVAQCPVQGIDVVTINALFQLIYYGHYELALEYSHQIWRTLFDDEDSGPYPHLHFCSTIYLHRLEESYKIIRDGGSININAFQEEMEGYEIREDVEVYDFIFQSLRDSLDIERIISMHGKGNPRWLLMLNIHFLKYMKEKFGIPFMLSDRFWYMLTVHDLYGFDPDPANFLYIPFPTLQDHFNKHSDKLFLSNEEEMFGKAWGLKYVYLFLHESGLISSQLYSLMKENIQALIRHYIQNVYYNLWNMHFIMCWPKIEPDDLKLFQMITLTYEKVEDDVRNSLYAYIDSLTVPERIMKEISQGERLKEKERLAERSAEFSRKTYVREEAKTGRNDPCPCGSGKKYKKCCMDQS